MANNELTYNDFLQRLNIQELLVDAGYQLNKRDGLRYPSYVKVDSHGQRVRGDKFIVTGNGKCCFQPPEQKNYNVIGFIKEHPTLFDDYKPGMSLDRLVNVVCNRLLNNPIDVRESRVAEPKRDAKPFNLSDYDILRFNPREKDTQRKHYPYFKERGINMGTQFAFHKHFFLVTKRRNDGLSFANLAFPLSLPSKPDSIVGLEERGRPRREDGKAYKGKAEGSNSSEGLWIANLTGKPLKETTNVLWFESAYDAMAEYQINPVKSVYVSTGGTPTKGQIKGMLEETRQANHYLGFDKDEAGRGFVKNFKAIAKEMGFTDCMVQAYHPLGLYKDWNDALLGKRDQRLIDQGEIDFDYFEFAKAQEAERQQEQERKQQEKEERTSGFRR